MSTVRLNGDCIKLVVFVFAGGLLSGGPSWLAGRQSGVTRAQIQDSCLYREDRAAVRNQLERAEEAIAKLTERVDALTRSSDALAARLDLVLGSAGVEALERSRRCAAGSGA